MTWQEKIAQLKNDGKFQEASRVFAFARPNASYVEKMRFADDFYQEGAYKQAQDWYEECIGEAGEEEYYYSTDIGGVEKDLGEEVLRAMQNADTVYERKAYAAAVNAYLPHVRKSRYAMGKLAECYFFLGDYGKAKAYYRELVQETDEGYFMFMLGECYTYAGDNEYANEHAVYWYQYALEKGCGYAYYPLGIAYQFGRGVEQDETKAEECFKKGLRYAVDRDNCYCKLGNFCYARKEYEKAKEYYEEGAKLNNARSLLNLAIGFFNRDFSGLDRKRVACQLAKAAALGNERAIDLYGKLKEDNRI